MYLRKLPYHRAKKKTLTLILYNERELLKKEGLKYFLHGKGHPQQRKDLTLFFLLKRLSKS